MEVELLSSASSPQSKKHYTVVEVMDMYCPMYLDAGMTYEQYWDGDMDMTVHYRKLLDRRRQWQNQMLWLQGRYFYDALMAVMPALSIKTKHTEIKNYTEEPYPITAQEVLESEERKERAQYEKNLNYMRSFMARNNARFEKKKEG